MENKNKPAFPVECSYTETEVIKGCQTGNTTGWETGLSKRELAFFIALGGCIAGSTLSDIDREHPLTVAKIVLRLVDAGFEALEKQPEP